MHKEGLDSTEDFGPGAKFCKCKARGICMFNDKWIILLNLQEHNNFSR